MDCKQGKRILFMKYKRIFTQLCNNIRHISSLLVTMFHVRQQNNDLTEKKLTNDHNEI